MPRQVFIYALAIAGIIGFASTALADTGVHGFTIPTVEDGVAPALKICISTSDAQWVNRGSSTTSVGVCLPAPSGALRTVNIPPVVVGALLTIESDITFRHDSIELSDGAIEAVHVVAAWMQDTPTARLAVSGHADATGTEEYNDALSEQRARMVGIFLTSNGVDESRLDLQWFGENELLVDTQKREEANRRVVITPVIE